MSKKLGFLVDSPSVPGLQNKYRNKRHPEARENLHSTEFGRGWRKEKGGREEEEGGQEKSEGGRKKETRGKIRPDEEERKTNGGGDDPVSW